MKVSIRPHTPADGLDAEERHVLKSLSVFGRGIGMERPEWKHWNRACDRLIERGFVEDVCGYVALTEAGRSQLQSNH